MNYSVRITVLIDNFSSRSDVLTEHGLALWIEYNGKNILFDTGQSNAIIKNAQKLGIDLSKTNVIVLSHGHYDHTGGLSGVLDFARNAQVYLHSDALEAKYGCKDGMSRYIGMCRESKQRLSEMLKSGRVTYTNNATAICDGAVITGQVSRKNEYEDTGGEFYNDESCCVITDTLMDDQSLFFESPKGLVVVCGCAHSGIVNTLNYISTLTKQNKIYAVIGGMHLVNAGAERIEKTISTFEKYDIQKIAPMHCTGDEAVRKMKAFRPEKCLTLGVAGQFCA
ncbi:MAG: MBL fold metallo-hydrolase [Phycisphaerae bacterium]|jgi:7,8-dihydropterin-6-yl-methyl-4-(beta-D-ribofuranosyl)aminobenzene 5'-phosphate synthase